MSFIEKNEENLEAMVFALTQRTKATIAVAIYDHESSRENAIAYLNKHLTYKTITFDVFGQKITSLLAFLRNNLPKTPSNTEEVSQIVHILRLDPLFFVAENHKVISSPLVAQINMERELLFHEVNAVLVLWVVRESYNRLRMDAPDFMDWVTATFVFETVEATPKVLSFDLPKETVKDRSQATLSALKEKADDIKRRAAKFDKHPKRSIRDQKELLNLLIALADAYTECHDLGNAQVTFSKAYTLAQENTLLEGFALGKLLGNWGEIETHLGNLEKAFVLYEEALEHFTLTEDKANIAVIYSKLGQTHSSLGNLDKALAFFEDDIRLTKELYEAYPNNVDFKNGLAISYSKLGDTHSSLGNLDKALAFFEEQNKIVKELYEAYPSNVDFKNGLAISYSKLGDTHSSLGNLDKALAFFEERSKLSEELYEAYPNNVSFKNGLAISYEKLGQTHSSLGNLDKALAFFEEQNKIVKELYEAYPNNVDFKNGLAISYSKLGQLHDKKGDIQKAFEYFKQDLRMTELTYQSSPYNVQFKRYLIISYKKMGEMSNKIGESNLAKDYYDKAKSLE
jgi:tetratricopeptide (TPR) repeat protein